MTLHSPSQAVRRHHQRPMGLAGRWPGGCMDYGQSARTSLLALQLLPVQALAAVAGPTGSLTPARPAAGLIAREVQALRAITAPGLPCAAHQMGAAYPDASGYRTPEPQVYRASRAAPDPAWLWGLRGPTSATARTRPGVHSGVSPPSAAPTASSRRRRASMTSPSACVWPCAGACGDADSCLRRRAAAACAAGPAAAAPRAAGDCPAVAGPPAAAR